MNMQYRRQLSIYELSSLKNYCQKAAEMVESTERRISIAGLTASGKTCLAICLKEDRFDPNTAPTLAVNVMGFNFKMGRKKVPVKLFDLRGHQRLEEHSWIHIRISHGIILVFDLTNARSFSSLEKTWRSFPAWFKEKIPPLVLVGNKSDLKKKKPEESDKLVTKARDLEKKYGIVYKEVSCLTGDGLEKGKLLEELLKRIEKNEFSTQLYEAANP
ncbi:MAG: Rab family GTPase, partial [Candidatus Hodarchaeales archaeon]|jgi:small GTP-binding protein